jgi:DnaJ homologue, subfamily C, member 28, conserved domain
MNAEDKREQRLRLLEDHIGRALAESEKSGELKTARSYGKPLDLGDGYEETPVELRMGYKILKDAGVLPPEVELMREVEALQRQLDAAAEGEAAHALRQRIAAKRLHLALRLERLRASGTL